MTWIRNNVHVGVLLAMLMVPLAFVVSKGVEAVSAQAPKVLPDMPVAPKPMKRAGPPVNVKTGKPHFTGLRPTPTKELLKAAFERPFHVKAAPPASCFIFPKNLDNGNMWLNNQYGDCVTAEEAFNKACFGVLISDATVKTWANANGDLDGADLQPVIQQMQAKGFSQDGNVYGDGAPLSVQYTSATVLQAAICQAAAQGGCIKLGIASDQLPSTAGNNMGWTLGTAVQDGNEDHCVSACGYGTIAQFTTAINAAYGLNLTPPTTTDDGTAINPTDVGYAVYTWSTIGWVSPGAFPGLTYEAWARQPSSVTTGTGTPSPDLVYSTLVTPPTPVPPTPTPTPTGPATLVAGQAIAPNTYSVVDAAGNIYGTETVSAAVAPGTYGVSSSPSGQVTLTVTQAMPSGSYTITGVGPLNLTAALSPGTYFLQAPGKLKAGK